MKREIMIFSLFLIFLMALPSGIKAQTFSVSYKEQTIEQITNDLRKKTGYQFVYKKEVADKVGPITCHYKNATFKELLNRIFNEEAGLDYEISNGTVIIKQSKAAQPYYKKLIYGDVSDSHDEPLAGVTVMVRGTGTGATTDLDGHFSIIVEGKNAQLDFSYLGMKNKTVAINQHTNKLLMVKLDADDNILNEVVVTGYQNIKRENATGSYQIISAKNLDERYTKDITSRLEGQIPGLTIYNNGNTDDGRASMVIRGAGTFQAKTSPLIVIDGLPIEGSIETVNPYNIENITVLKDASAAAIYGARASNGVIVITTKRAHDEKLSVDFNADFIISDKQSYNNRRWASASQALDLEENNFNYVAGNDELYNDLKGRYAVNPYALSMASRLMLQHKMGTMDDKTYNNIMSTWRHNDYRKEWKDVMLRTQVQQQYNAAIRNKGKLLNSNIVLNYSGDNMGKTLENDNTYQLSYLGDLSATKWLDLTFGVNLISDRAKVHAHDQYDDINFFAPYMSMYNADGTPAAMEASTYLGEPSLRNPSLGLESETFNLLDESKLNFTKSRRNNIRTFVDANFKILPEFSISTKFQYEDIIYKGETYLEGSSYMMRHFYNLGTSGGKHYIPEGGILRSTNDNGDFYTFRIQGNYAKVFAEKHSFEAIAGMEYRQSHDRSTNNLLLGYDDQSQTNMNYLVNFYDLNQLTTTDLGANYSPVGSMPTATDYATTDILHRFYSVYLNANYTYDSRYCASFSYRVDKADLFGADPKFRGRPLWSAGASWNIDHEPFMKSVTWVDALKLRTSYGLTGNIDQNVSSYLTATIAVNDINGKKGATLNTPPNDQLRWEKTASWNVGLDFSLFNNRLSGSLDGYSKTSSDLLALTDVDPTTGWTSLNINNGKARNTGIELQLNGAIIAPQNMNDFGISASFNIAYNNNKVLHVDHQPSSGMEALNTLHEGRPINSLYSYRFAGMKNDNSGVQSYGWYDKAGNVHTTDIASGDFGVDDVVFSGGLDPRVTASFVPEITWKGFSLSGMFALYGGHYMRATMEDWGHGGTQYGYNSMEEPLPAAYLNYWNATDKNSAVANGYPGYQTIGTPDYIDQTVMHADYIKLRNVVLGYRFSKRICDVIGVRGMRLRIQVNNVATWVRNSQGIDPEAVNPVTGYAIAKPCRSYTMSVGINL